MISLCVVGHDRRSASLSTVRVANQRPIRSLTHLYYKKRRKYEKEYKKTSIQAIFTPKSINPLFEELSKVNRASDLNVAYNCSQNKLRELCNKILSHKTATNKAIKLQHKPWLTMGLLKSLQLKNNLYKKISKKSNSRVQIQIYATCTEINSILC